MRYAILLSVGLWLASPVSAWSGDPTKPLFACLKAAREELAVAMEPLPGSPPMRPVVVISCDGRRPVTYHRPRAGGHARLRIERHPETRRGWHHLPSIS